MHVYIAGSIALARTFTKSSNRISLVFNIRHSVNCRDSVGNFYQVKDVLLEF